MNNCDFRNAVIGKNGLTDPIWPFLDESNDILKRRNKQLITPQRDIFVSTDNGPSFECLPSSSQTNDNISSTLNGESQIETNFPELLKSVVVKNYLNGYSSKKKSNLKFEIKKVINDHNYKKSRTPKFRDKINISLSSLIKSPAVKNKSHNKKIIIKKSILCGNKLDGDRPVRKKGKSRLLRKRYLTQLKKAIILSRSLKKKDVYNQSFHKVKCFIPCLYNSLNNSNIGKLERLLGSLSIEEEKRECNKENILAEDNQGNKVSTKEIAKTLLHSKKFRKYSSNIVTPNLIKNVESLVVRLRNLQDKQHAKDPNKTFSKRRYLCGFRETKRFILCDCVKAVIVATDLEIDSDLPSGSPLNEIKHLAEERSIPIVFAGKVKQLSYWTMKKQKISIVSILRYEGAEQLYNDFILSWEESKKIYENIINEIEMHLRKNISSEVGVSQDVEQEIRDNIISKLSKEIIGTENKINDSDLL